RDDDFYAAILLPAFGSAVIGYWHGLPESRGSDGAGIETLIDQVLPHGLRALLGKRLIEGIAADIVRVPFNLQIQPRMRQHDAGKFGEALAGFRTQIEFRGGEKHVAEIHHQATRRVARLENLVELR